METSTMVDRGRASAELIGVTLQRVPPVILIRRRRKTRAERVTDALQALPAVARVGLVAAAAGAAIGIAAYVARKRLFTAAAVVAEVVEQAADAVEDAAEDGAKAARERSEAPEAR